MPEEVENAETFVSNDDISQSESICDIATNKCTETWVCSTFGGCKCVDNCKCHTNTFTKEMNDFCVSLGDCGAYINYIGDGTDTGYTVRGAPRLSVGQFGYSQYANKPATPAPPGESAFFETLNPESLPAAQQDDGTRTAFENELLGAAGEKLFPSILVSS